MRAISRTTTIVVLVVIVIAVGAAIAGYLSLTPTIPPATTGPTTTAVARADFNSLAKAHLAVLSVRNISGAITFYEPSATVTWLGVTQGLGGSYPGTGNIQVLFESALGNAQNMNFTITQFSNKSVSSTQENATSSVLMQGNSKFLGEFNGMISLSTVYENSGGKWLIKSETWFFHTFNVQYSAGATTFPQWQRSGPPINRTTGNWFKDFVYAYGGLGVAAAILGYAVVVMGVVMVKKPWKR